jgi:hypothetical protein
VVTANSSIAGLPCANKIATASSWPGSQSRMIFCGLVHVRDTLILFFHINGDINLGALTATCRKAYSLEAWQFIYSRVKRLNKKHVKRLMLLWAWTQALSAAPLISEPPECSPQKTSAGVRQPSRFRGRLFSLFTACLVAFLDTLAKSVPFGKYCLNKPFVFSLEPR